LDEKEIQKIIDNALEIHTLKKKNTQLTEELKRNNAELARLNNELLELDKLKLQFLNIISHEIRTR
jgi:signal transduction histidine kinase